MKIEFVILENNFVRLEPLRHEHLADLCAVGLDKSIWLWTTNVVEDESDMRRYVEAALEESYRKISLPFVTIDKSSNRIVGSTRFGNIDLKNRRVEIGWTWINPGWQRTFINTAAKRLMLAHAFEIWNCIRVELKTDVLNEKSRKDYRANGRKRRRHIALSRRYRRRSRPRYGLLQHSRIGMVFGKGKFRPETRTDLKAIES